MCAAPAGTHCVNSFEHSVSEEDALSNDALQLVVLCGRLYFRYEVIDMPAQGKSVDTAQGGSVKLPG